MKINFSIFVLLSCVSAINLHAQFAPQAGLAGSTAIYKDSSIILEWATLCHVQPSWMDIADTTLGKVSLGDSSSAYGYPNGDVVSLGDGGEALYYLDNPISNAVGPDFVIFENGFRSPDDSSLAYLELAEVEVSSDGIHFTGFKTVCHLDTAQQIAGTGEYMDCRKLHNFAGKYIANYGTPFDLSEIIPDTNIDIHAIRFVRIRDIIGTIQLAYAQHDASHHIINDPYPTPFPTGGFDLDALGIIHTLYPTKVSHTAHLENIKIYPNPIQTQLHIDDETEFTLFVYSWQGQLLQKVKGNSPITLDTSSWSSGLYSIVITSPHHLPFHQTVIK